MYGGKTKEREEPGTQWLPYCSVRDAQGREEFILYVIPPRSPYSANPWFPLCCMQGDLIGFLLLKFSANSLSLRTLQRIEYFSFLLKEVY
jgi:hypothetical protein